MDWDVRAVGIRDRGSVPVGIAMDLEVNRGWVGGDLLIVPSNVAVAVGEKPGTKGGKGLAEASKHALPEAKERGLGSIPWVRARNLFFLCPSVWRSSVTLSKVPSCAKPKELSEI